MRTGPARVESYTWLYVLAGLISVLFAAGAAYVLVRPSFDFHIKRWWGVLKEAFPIGLAIILVSFYYWNGTTFLTKMSGDEAVGAYSAAFRVVLGYTVHNPFFFGEYLSLFFPIVCIGADAVK